MDRTCRHPSAPGAITFPPDASVKHSSQRTHPLFANTFSVPTITDGYDRARWPQRLFALLLRRPDCTLSRPVARTADDSNQPVTQSIATPEPSSRTITTLDRVLVGRWSLECVTTPGADGLSRMSCRPSHLNIDRFHQPCLLPGRTSRTSEDCHLHHVATTHPCRQPSSSSMRVAGGTCHADKTVPWQDVISPSLPAFATPYNQVFAHTQVRDPHESAAACFWHASELTLPGHHKSGHTLSGLDVVCFLVSLRPDHVHPSTCPCI